MVSFIVPALNAEATLGLCLDAILAARANGRQREVLVIDNGSSDRTVQVAQQRGVRLMSGPRLTVAGLRNLGARLSSGDIIALVDADCVIAPHWLEKALGYFADPAVGAVGAPTQIPSGATWVQRAWAVHRHRDNRPGPVEWLPTENLLIRKSAFLGIGGFNEALTTCEDVDFCYRLGARYRIMNDPDIQSTHLGEAPTLARFLRKEAWRGRGNIAGLFSHRLRASELPSVLWPVHHVVGILALVATVGYWVAGGSGLCAALTGAMLIAPSLLLALSTVIRVRQPRWWAGLTLVYMTYAAARSLAVCAALPPWPATATRKSRP